MNILHYGHFDKSISIISIKIPKISTLMVRYKGSVICDEMQTFNLPQGKKK
jgi:hypothetical protein